MLYIASLDILVSNADVAYKMHAHWHVFRCSGYPELRTGLNAQVGPLSKKDVQRPLALTCVSLRVYDNITYNPITT